jgi:hypothetical protein
LVRPLKGEHAKKITTISIDPVVWKTFQDIVESKEPDGDTSASSHVETLLKKEIADITGKDPDAAAVNERQLQNRLTRLTKRKDTLYDMIGNGGKEAWDRANKLGNAYELDFEYFRNSEQVIRNMLLDYYREGSDVRKFFDYDEGSMTEFNLLIQFIRVLGEREKVNAALLDAMVKQAGITVEDIKEARMPNSQDAEDNENTENHRHTIVDTKSSNESDWVP